MPQIFKSGVSYIDYGGREGVAQAIEPFYDQGGTPHTFVLKLGLGTVRRGH
jgi:hypothetical protein